MATLRLVVQPDLALLLRRGRLVHDFDVSLAAAASLKHAIESVGIPHTEIARIEVDGEPARIEAAAAAGSIVQIWGWSDLGSTQSAARLLFVADAHLGGLARYLRMLGFDTLHDGGISDETIRFLALSEHRIVLTRDRELLKCSDVKTGCYVRATEPVEQLREVDRRFGLASHVHPFTRCLRCNGALHSVDKAVVLASLPPAVARNQESFVRCTDCHRIYWPGSHYERMQETIKGLLQ